MIPILTLALVVIGGCKKGETTQQEEMSVPHSASYSSADQKLLVGVCYYPWYRVDAHWGASNLRCYLDPPQPPELGTYDCIEQATISKHVDWSAQGGVDFWISSWWGQGSDVDYVILEGQLQNKEFVRQMGYCILYEPTQGTPLNVTETYISRFLSDVSYLAENHFVAPNYLKIDNMPVLYIYLSRTMQGNWAKLFQSADSLLQGKGFAGLYVVGDEVYWGQFSETRLPYMEAVTAYNPHVSQSWVADPAYFISVITSQVYSPWMAIANRQGKSFWVDVIPGFNDMGVRPEMLHPVIPRGNTTTFSQFLQSAKGVLKQQTVPLKVLVVTSWNEWHEDSQIEPTVVVADPTQRPTTLTRGNWYHGYGTRYLDTLRSFKDHFWE